MIEAKYEGGRTFWGVCQHCRKDYLEPLWDTEWTDGRTRTVDVLCENCLHRETIYLSIERRGQSRSE